MELLTQSFSHELPPYTSETSSSRPPEYSPSDPPTPLRLPSSFTIINDDSNSFISESDSSMIERNHAAFQQIRTFGQNNINDQNDTLDSQHNSSGELTPNASEPAISDGTARNLVRYRSGSQNINSTLNQQHMTETTRETQAIPQSLANYPEIKILPVPSVKSGDWRTFGSVRCRIMLNPHANVEYIAKGTIWITSDGLLFIFSTSLSKNTVQVPSGISKLWKQMSPLSPPLTRANSRENPQESQSSHARDINSSSSAATTSGRDNRRPTTSSGIRDTTRHITAADLISFPEPRSSSSTGFWSKLFGRGANKFPRSATLSHEPSHSRNFTDLTSATISRPVNVVQASLIENDRLISDIESKPQQHNQQQQMSSQRHQSRAPSNYINTQQQFPSFIRGYPTTAFLIRRPRQAQAQAQAQTNNGVLGANGTTPNDDLEHVGRSTSSTNEKRFKRERSMSASTMKALFSRSSASDSNNGTTLFTGTNSTSMQVKVCHSSFGGIGSSGNIPRVELHIENFSNLPSPSSLSSRRRNRTLSSTSPSSSYPANSPQPSATEPSSSSQCNPSSANNILSDCVITFEFLERLYADERNWFVDMLTRTFR